MDESTLKDGIFIGQPTLEEIKNYFLKEKRLADIRLLERQKSPEKDSSPELSESFEIYLKQRRKKVQDEKQKLAEEANKENQEPPIEIDDSLEEIEKSLDKSTDAQKQMNELTEEIQEEHPTTPVKTPIKIQPPRSVKKLYTTPQTAKMTPKPLRRIDSPEIEDIDDSFLELEKMCENTLTLNNVSEHLTDLTSLETSIINDLMKKKLSINPEETRKSMLDDVEPPSFINNLTMFSPKNSPLRKTVHENRPSNVPSTIMEVTELSTTTKSSASSYRTADAMSTYEKSECYQTANEESWLSGSIKKRAFFDDTNDFTKDSLDVTQKPNITQMSRDSLNEQTVDATADSTYEENLSFNNNGGLNDTLEAIERILAQGNFTPQQKVFNQSKPSTPQAVLTPKPMSVTPKQPAKASPTPWSSTKTTKIATARVTPSNSPLIKFSPSSATKSPMTNFKLPKQPLSSSKTTPFVSTHSKKFQHIVSPIARYINNTPELPLSANVHTQYGLGSSRSHFNFRDSDSFSRDRRNNLPTSGSSLPMRAKTKTTTPSFNSAEKKIVGGEKFQKLLAHSNAAVAVHKKDKKEISAKLFMDNTLANETMLSDVSFPASNLPVDDSILIVEEVKRIK